MLVSIIIPAYNDAPTLAKCLAACLEQTHMPCEVILVDDGSRDATAEVAVRYPGVQYVRQENAGPAAARNRGAEAAKGDVLAFTDADCVPQADWVAKLLEGFDAEGVAGAGGTYGIANPEFPLARLVHAEIIARHAQFGREVDFLGSFNVAYRAEAFRAAGGFDPAFRRASGEDNDLAYRLADAGGKLRFVPEAVVAHYHPTRWLSYLRAQARHGYWRMKLYAKHPRRAGGDQYAGPADLLAPPCAALLGIGLPIAAFFGARGLALWGGCAIAYYLLHLPLAWRLAGKLRPCELLCFAALASLRDGARAVGLAGGIGTFWLTRKDRP